MLTVPSRIWTINWSTFSLTCKRRTRPVLRSCRFLPRYSGSFCWTRTKMTSASFCWKTSCAISSTPYSKASPSQIASAVASPATRIWNCMKMVRMICWWSSRITWRSAKMVWLSALKLTRAIRLSPYTETCAFYRPNWISRIVMFIWSMDHWILLSSVNWPAIWRLLLQKTYTLAFLR